MRDADRDGVSERAREREREGETNTHTHTKLKEFERREERNIGEREK